jgi:hypothetical protein
MTPEHLQERIEELEGQLEKVAPLIDALHRISTDDGHGEAHGPLDAEEMRTIARQGLAQFWPMWTAAEPVRKKRTR